MPRPVLALSTAVLIACGLSVASAQTKPPQQNAAPAAETGSNPSAQQQAPNENRKHSGTNDESGPSAGKPTADQNSQGDHAAHSVSGRLGKEEPSSHAPGEGTAVLVDGKLNVPGAPADSQTVPAKFSERNAGLDKLPMMALPLPLNDEQRRAIVDSVKQANAPEQSTAAKPADALPGDIAMHDLGESANSIPQVEGLKYVRTPDRVLLVRPEIRVVVGELESK
jgi:hypothetical protein